MERLLAICIPTYNRRNVLVPDVKRYLSVSDQRFCIKISDNCSIDGTDAEILKIKDDRLIYNKSKSNIGGIANGYYALIGSPSKFVFILLDKDTLDERLLPYFLDYLEEHSPMYGYVDLSNKGEMKEIIYKAGVEAILQTAYKSKHPSGFFYRTNLYETEASKDYYKSLINDFPFHLDILSASLGSKYDAVVFYWPFIINANLRNNEVKKYSGTYTYNNENVFFGKEQRIRSYNYYLKHMLDLDILICNKEEISVKLTETGLSWVSTELRTLFHHKMICEHYHVTVRKISFIEMTRNIISLIEVFVSTSQGRLPRIFILRQSLLLGLKAFARSVFFVAKESITKPISKPINA